MTFEHLYEKYMQSCKKEWDETKVDTSFDMEKLEKLNEKRRKIEAEIIEYLKEIENA